MSEILKPGSPGSYHQYLKADISVKPSIISMNKLPVRYFVPYLKAPTLDESHRPMVPGRCTYGRYKVLSNREWGCVPLPKASSPRVGLLGCGEARGAN